MLGWTNSQNAGHSWNPYTLKGPASEQRSSTSTEHPVAVVARSSCTGELLEEPAGVPIEYLEFFGVLFGQDR